MNGKMLCVFLPLIEIKRNFSEKKNIKMVGEAKDNSYIHGIKKLRL